MNALIVSEQASRRKWVRSCMGEAWTYHEASNGRDAMRIVDEKMVDLVITDQTAEPFGAFGLSREVKVLIDPPAVIVLLERPQDAWLARWSGADQWFLPPYDPFALAEAAAQLTKTKSGGSRT